MYIYIAKNDTQTFQRQMKIYVKEGSTKMKEVSFLQIWITFRLNDTVSSSASSGSFNVKEH